MVANMKFTTRNSYVLIPSCCQSFRVPFGCCVTVDVEYSFDVESSFCFHEAVCPFY